MRLLSRAYVAMRLLRSSRMTEEVIVGIRNEISSIVRRLMRKFATILLSATYLSLFSYAVQEKSSTTPVFTSGTNFVQVPVIVQRSGRHVSGLKRENFIVRQDGRDQPVASFEEIHRGANLSNPESKAEASQAGPTRQQITIIALDTVDTPNLDRAYFTDQFQRYLTRSGGFGGPIALVAIERSGIHVLREFTNDPRALLSAITKDANAQPTANNNSISDIRDFSDALISQSQTQLANVPDAGPTVADALRLRSADEAMIRFQDRSSRLDTLYAVQQLAQALKGLPGRKSLLLVGSGFKFIDSNTVMKSISGGSGGIDLNYSVENVGQTMNQTLYTWKLLNDANVAVYPIDTRRTVNSAFNTMDPSVKNTPSDLSFEQNRQADRDVLDSFKTMAAATGGKPCFYRTDLDNCVREAVDDDHDYYLLGFYVDKKNSQPGWHKIDVKLEEKASVRYRQGFMIAKFNPEAQRKTDLGLALSSPFAYTELPFTGRFDSVDGKSAKFTLMIPPEAITVDESTGHIDFDVVAIARAAGGKEAGRVAQHVDRKFPRQSVAEIMQIGINYSNRMELASGDYGVWFVVRDNLGGRTGSAVVPLKVP